MRRGQKRGTQIPVNQQPVDLTQLADQARTLGYSTSAQVIIRLQRMIVRNQSYLERRAERGTHTPTDDAIAEDCAVVALAIQYMTS